MPKRDEYYSREKYNGKKNPHQQGGDNSRKQQKNLVKVKLPLNEGPYAPYNFVRIRNQVVEAPEDGKYSEISDKAYTGKISYTITSQTPIFVDDGGGEFYRNKDDVCSIPGSTMRGLIRNNLQILSFSSVRDDIDDYNLMYRAVAGGCLMHQYQSDLGQSHKDIQGKQMTVLENVKAGYISCENGKYYFYKNVRDPKDDDSDKSSQDIGMDYYVVSEKYVLEEAKDNFNYIINSFQNYMGKDGKLQEKNKNSKNPYRPYFKPISYQIKNGKVTGIAKDNTKDNKYDKRGYVLSSGQMRKKKVFYVIPEMDKNTREKIPDDAVRAYRIDCKRKENTILKENRRFYELPKEGESPRPFFYIKLGERFYFGYTPHLRLMYRNSISKAVKQGSEQDENLEDFARNIFGYSKDKISKKSKVFFTDAVLKGDEKKADEKKLILLEPKPTSYLEYLKQTDSKEVVTYNTSTEGNDNGTNNKKNNDNMQIRGIKQYWLHDKINERSSSDNENVSSTLHPLEEGSSFEGEIRFQNLTKEELGLLIWSLVLEKDSQMNVGKAKAYGFGRIKVDQAQLYLLGLSKAYKASTATLSQDPFEIQSEDAKTGFVDFYKEYVSNELGKDIMEQPSIQDFLAMKSAASFLNESFISYMPLGDTKDKQGAKTYQRFKENNNPLPTVHQISNSAMKSNEV